VLVASVNAQASAQRQRVKQAQPLAITRTTGVLSVAKIPGAADTALLMTPTSGRARQTPGAARTGGKCRTLSTCVREDHPRSALEANGLLLLMWCSSPTHWMVADELSISNPAARQGALLDLLLVAG
jgi:hypothetical protein